MEISKMTAEQLVQSFSIFLRGDKIATIHMPEDPEARAELMDAMRGKKQEIVQYLRGVSAQEERAAQERQAKIDAIPGLKELRAAIEDLDSWREECRENIDCGASGVGLRAKPEYDLDAMYKQYPEAAAYIKADAMSRAEHYVKAAAGKKAKDRIINGEDCGHAIADAEKEWHDYVTGNVWGS